MITLTINIEDENVELVIFKLDFIRIQISKGVCTGRGFDVKGIK